MKAEDIRIAAVIGAGTMGHGIAQVLATAGIETRLYDVMPGMVERGLGSARANLDKGVEKGKVDAKVRDAAVARLSGTTKLEEALDGAQCAVEAVPEKLELKQTIFADLGKRLGPEVLLGTNTSSLSVTGIAAVTPHPEDGRILYVERGTDGERGPLPGTPQRDYVDDLVRSFLEARPPPPLPDRRS
jgi:3-hydroxybutyryl-CoA dehydrogenase